jgi:hypothetical protein
LFTLRPMLLSLAFGVITACGTAGPTKTLTKAIDRDNAEAVSVELKMTAGELHVGGGAMRLLDSVFTFNVPEWEPAVEYRRDGTRGILSIRQPVASPSFRNTENKWDLRLNETVPLSLTASITAGEGSLVLGALNLQRVQVDAGAGEFTLDLLGTPRRSYDVKVNAGVGESHIRIPRSVGIVATATTGIGEVNVNGLQKVGNTWINPGHEQDAVMIHVNISGGVGEIQLSAE